MSSTSTKVNLEWPAGAVRALVDFGHSPCKVINARLSSNGVSTSIESHAHGVVLQRTAPCAGIISEAAEIEFNKEASPYARVTYFNHAGVAGLEATTERNQAIYQARKAWCDANIDPIQRYFLELDSQTHVDFMRFVVTDETELAFRFKAVESVLLWCWSRIGGRYGVYPNAPGNEVLTRDTQANRWPMSVLPQPRRSVAYLSDVFLSASDQLDGDLFKVRIALEEFAAGRHRLELPIPGLCHPEVLTEPDSSNVFLFAEFGFLCISMGVDVSTWTYLLPTLVKMQPLFVYRIPNRKQYGMCVKDYKRTPDKRLSDAEWDTIGREYDREFSIEELRLKMGTNLADLADCI